MVIGVSFTVWQIIFYYQSKRSKTKKQPINHDEAITNQDFFSSPSKTNDFEIVNKDVSIDFEG
jgi:hypothetical protein